MDDNKKRNKNNKKISRKESINERFRDCKHPYFIYGQVCHNCGKVR
jgi:uncharacterized OB-fold protein